MEFTQLCGTQRWSCLRGPEQAWDYVRGSISQAAKQMPEQWEEVVYLWDIDHLLVVGFECLRHRRREYYRGVVK